MTPSLAGAWLGTLQVPAAKLRIVFNISSNPDGSLTATLDSPDQGATGTAISSVRVANGRVTLESSVVQGRYEGTLSADGAQIEGQWSQSGMTLPLVLKRIEDVPKVNRPQEPKKPYPYREEEVAYRNEKDGITLAGTLTMPPTGGPFPAVILITGSGAQDRNETVFGHRPFLVLADYLTHRGMAVLRADDRGVGGSTGNISQATSESFAEDVLAGIAYLKSRREIDAKNIGLIGHSEGGIVAPLAAVRSVDVSFIVLMAGTGVPGDRIIEGQIERLLKAGGAEPALIESTIETQRRVYDVVRSETDPDRLKQRVRRILTDAVSKLDERQKQAIGYSDAYVDIQVRAAESEWFRFFITHDPKATLRKVGCPVLAVNGALDVQVSPTENLQAIEQALREGGNPRVTVRALPGLNHLFQTATTGAVDEYARIEETIAPVALETLAKWMKNEVVRK